MAKRKTGGAAETVYKPQPINPELLKRVAKLDPPEKPKEIRDTNGTGLVLRHEPTGRLNFYVQIARSKRARPFDRRCDARRVLEGKPTLATVKAEALRLRSAYINDGIDIAAERRADRAVPTFAEYLKDTYTPWALDERKSGAETIARLKSCFSKDFDRLPLTEITKANVSKWKAKRRKAGVTAETINRDIQALRAALSKAVEWDIIKANPLAGVELAQVDRHKKVVRALNEAEKAQVLEMLKARDDSKRAERVSANQWREQRGRELLPKIGAFADVLTPAVITSFETGLRRGELFALEWPMLDFAGKVVRVKGTTAKSYETRDVPLNKAALETLRAWWMQCGQPKEGHVFTENGRPVKNLRHSYQAVLEAAGIKRVNAKGERVNWHSLRHTFGTLLGAAGVDPETLRELMGHAKLETTQRYLHSDADRKREAVERLHA